MPEEDGHQDKRQRSEGAAPWPTWGPGSAELQADIPGQGKLKVAVNIADGGDGTKGQSCVIASGICFLDHMVDQLTAHAQLRVSLQASLAGKDVGPHSNELAKPEVDAELARCAGAAIGQALRAVLVSRAPATSHAEPAAALGAAVASMQGGAAEKPTYRFCAPLDEAFTELFLDFPVGAGAKQGAVEISLAPYGTFPPAGRKRIGSFRTELTDIFFASLARSLGCGLRARKVRGENAHHIVEATFKSFARCFRKAMDGLCKFDAAAYPAQAGKRAAQQKRATKETSIDIAVDLDPLPSAPPGAVSTGLATLDTLLKELQAQSGVGLKASCSGDLWIDDHHSTEDVMITVGKVLAQSFGDKGGFTRMGCAEGCSGSARVLCVMDLSNRPSLCHTLRLQARGEEMAGDVSVEMVQHCFESLCHNALITVHLEQVDEATGASEAGVLDIATAAMRAFGSALRECAAIDPRRAGVTASSKGTLSK